MTYEEALQYVAALAPRGWRLGLDRMQEFAERCQLDAGKSGSCRYIHVAGTNGKGSTTAFLQSLLVEQGYRTGAFFSPYVVDPRERIQINRDLIGKEAFAELVERIRPVAEAFDETPFGGISEFEFKTAMGFSYWESEHCKAVALEVGLGGNLDATNIVSPSACIVVSIGLDHQAILGDTKELIAAEKAGIIKAGIPVVIGEMDEGPLAVIVERAREVGAPAYLFGRDFGVRPLGAGFEVWVGETIYAGLRPGLTGAMQSHNMACAVAALHYADMIKDAKFVADGVARAWAPGRRQRVRYRGVPGLADGAHNIDSAGWLAHDLSGKHPFVFTMVSGHDLDLVVNELKENMLKVFVPPLNSPRAQSPESVATQLNKLGVEAVPCQTLEEALRGASEMGEFVIAGSFYLVGEAIHLCDPAV